MKLNYTTHIQEIDNKHHLHPFTEHKALRKKNPRVITSAEGVYIHDSEGQKILDGMSGLWCVNLGYGVEALCEAGSTTLRELPFYNTFFQTTTPPAALLAQKIASVTPEGLDHIFFASSGSEANDTAVKLIWYYNNLRNKPNKKAIITRHLAYHGSTIVAASMCGLGGMHGRYDLPLDRFHHIEPTPCAYRYAEEGESETDFAMRCAKALEDKILELGADNVAAFAGEPVMGAGGLMMPPKGYWAEIRRICTKYDVILWADEVICGFGRTGSWFGSQTYGFQPDIITMAKGLSSGYQPISAVALNEEIGGVIVDADEEMAHGYTYSVHPVAASVAIKAIEIYDEMGFCEGGGESAYFQEQIGKLESHPLVGEVRGLGYLAAVELVSDKATKARFEPEGSSGYVCREHCFNNDVIIRAVGDVMIIAPPLIISKSEVDELVSKFTTSLNAAYTDLTSKA